MEKRNKSGGFWKPLAVICVLALAVLSGFVCWLMVKQDGESGEWRIGDVPNQSEAKTRTLDDLTHDGEYLIVSGADLLWFRGELLNKKVRCIGTVKKLNTFIRHRNTMTAVVASRDEQFNLLIPYVKNSRHVGAGPRYEILRDERCPLSLYEQFIKGGLRKGSRLCLWGQLEGFSGEDSCTLSVDKWAPVK